jgi:hypothetical protein
LDDVLQEGDADNIEFVRGGWGENYLEAVPVRWYILIWISNKEDNSITSDNKQEA